MRSSPSRRSGIAATASSRRRTGRSTCPSRCRASASRSSATASARRIVEILAPSPERVAPICRHFGACGGCALQMMPLEATRKLKRDFVVAALKQRGLAPEVAETVGVPLASRRRAVLTALRAGKALRPRLSRAALAQRRRHRGMPGARAGACRRGSPISARSSRRWSTGRSRRALTVLLDDARARHRYRRRADRPARARSRSSPRSRPRIGLARLSVGGEPVLTLAEPALDIAGVALTPPPGAFVQASAEAEAAMTALVTEHLAGAKRVADLFCRRRHVRAGAGAHMRRCAPSKRTPRRLQRSRRRAPQRASLKPIETEARDLFADPLSPQELETVRRRRLRPAPRRRQGAGGSARRVEGRARRRRLLQPRDLRPRRAHPRRRRLRARARRARRPVRLFGGDGSGRALPPRLKAPWTKPDDRSDVMRAERPQPMPETPLERLANRAAFAARQTGRVAWYAGTRRRSCAAWSAARSRTRRAEARRA